MSVCVCVYKSTETGKLINVLVLSRGEKSDFVVWRRPVAFFLKSLPEDMFIDLREKREERERNIDHIRPDQGSNLQPRCMP